MVMTLLTRPKVSVATVIVATDGSGDFNCDGTCDDVEIQAAIDFLPAGGGVIYIKEGTYNMCETVTLNQDNISIIGSGRSTQIISDGNNTVFFMEDNFCSIENLYTDAGALVNQAIRVLGDNCFVRGCWITNASRGVIALYLSRVIITGNFIYDCNEGIRLEGLGVGLEEVENSLVSSNQIYSNDSFGVFLFNTNHCIVEGNLIYLNTNPGIYLYRANNNLIHGNHTYGNAVPQIDEFSCSNNLVFDNTEY